MGAAVVGVLLLHAVHDKTAATRHEMFYLCHVSSAVIALGLLARAPRVLATGFLLLATLGVPSWLVYAVLTHNLTASSVLVHLLPLGLAARVIARDGLAQGTYRWALGVEFGVVALSALFFPSDVNLNLAHRPGPGMEWLTVGVWPWRAMLAAASAGMLLAAERLVRSFCP